MKLFKYSIQAALLIMLFVVTASVFAADEQVELNGTWEQGGIIVGRVPRQSTVAFEGIELKISESGHFVLGLGPDAKESVTLTIVPLGGKVITKKFKVKQRQYDVQRVNGVEQKHVTPPPELTARIQKEADLVKKARQLSDDRLDFVQDFIWPVSGPITGVYGSQRIYNGVPRSPHYGLDIAAPIGTKVVAPAGGIVTLAEKDLFYSGGTLIIDHGYGLSSTFIHLNKLYVEVGSRVEQGDPVAEVGATGRVTGPHLDWRMNWFDVRLDPALLMKGKPMPQTSSPQRDE
jgi:murein DD-endopeptidase MepM/ murein hydrolase activator NlpD